MAKPVSRTTSTTAELRADIDRGLTGDKVRVEDPAAAPLGTDDEAAGTPASPELIARTRANELKIGDQVRRSAARERKAAHAEGAIPWLLVAAFLVSLLALAWLAAALLR